MTDDLVKRLRWLGDHASFDPHMHHTAADRIEKLEAEVERLVKSRNKWGKLYNQTLEKLRLSVMSDSEYVKIIDEKCAEQATRIEKLEAALREIDEWAEDHCMFGLRNLVRKALEGKDD